MQLHITPSIFIGRTVRSESLVIKFIFFFRKAVLRKLFDIRFSYRDKVYSKTNHQSKVAELKSLLFGAAKIVMKNGQTTDPKLAFAQRMTVRKKKV